MVSQLIAIAAGGAIGAVLRYLGANAVYKWLGTGFPWGTLAVNIVGSLLMGFLSVMLLERALLDASWRAVLMVGLLGAFTTFSTFSMETLNLLQSGQLMKAGLNMLLSVVLCVMAAWIGVLAGRQL